MRITNLLHFTENHPFYCGRFFALGTLHYTMLNSVYQPMIGTQAISLYHVLYDLLPAQQVGYTPIEQQRKLFLSLQLEPGPEGRRKLIDAASRLEAVGLLKTSRSYIVQDEEFVYYYHLLAPLMPHDFFSSHHLVYLLRDTIGVPALMRLKERLFSPAPFDEASVQETEDLTVPFYELFKLSRERDASDTEVVLDELAVGMIREQDMPASPEIGYPYADIMRRFPRASRNRKYVERLEKRKDQLAFINYTAAKYRLELQELCRLLDEDGIFDEAGELIEETFAYRASLSYMQQSKRREERDVIVKRSLEMKSSAEGESDETVLETSVEPSHQLDVPELFAGKCTKQQYNHMLRNEPYTGMLERFFQGKPPIHAVRLFERIHFAFGMPDEVMNIIMHYIHTNRLSWSKAFVESIFTDLLAREVRSFEGAVDYIRERLQIAAKSKERAAGKTAATSHKRTRRPSPAIVTEDVPEDSVTDEEYERILQKVRSIESRLK